MAKTGTISDQFSFHAMVQGKVQGVGFRAFVSRSAEQLGITGWVRNRGASKVELMFSATSEQSEAFVADLNTGPARAKVDTVDLRSVRTRTFDGFKRLTSKGQAGSEPTEQPPLYRFDPNFLTICQTLADKLPAQSTIHNQIDNIPSDWGLQQLFTEALKHGYQIRRLGRTRPRMHLLEGPNGRLGLVATRPSHASVLQTTIADDKTLAALALAPLADHLPQSWQVSSATDALPHLKSVDSLVAKPSRGSTAKGVTTHISTEDDLREAFQIARGADPDGRVQLEEHICGVDLRILFTGRTLVAAYLRFPANVVGDGHSTIFDLITSKNHARANVPGIGLANPVPTNALTKSLLTDQELDLDAVPIQGQFVQLGLRPNTADGADQIDITDIIHRDIIEICENAIGLLGEDGFWGFDILSEDFTQPASKARVVICEANNRPFGGVFRHATHGTHHNFFAAALRTLSARTESKSRKAARAKPLPTIRLADTHVHSDNTPVDAETSLGQALCQALGSNYTPWQPGLILHNDAGHITALDTLAPTQFSEHILRPKNEASLRDVLESAGCQLLPWKTIPDTGTLRALELPSQGRIIMSAKWRRRFDIVLSDTDSAMDLAQKIPPTSYPLRLEHWGNSQMLHAVAIEGRLIAAAQSHGSGFQTYERLIPGLKAHCQRVFEALPGLNRARLVFRRTKAPRRPWLLQAISMDLMHDKFAAPTKGPSVDIAAALAERIGAGTDQIKFNAAPPA
ncbi:MAG: acylphosphatase [Cognatishimia sp.]|uniref:acylphosphatase n=1 Tax=Cognatishimia sp. TaxID=2211648 RepID=UPI003B8AF9C2